MKLELLLIIAIEGRQKEIIVTLFSTADFSILVCCNNFPLDWHFRKATWETKVWDRAFKTKAQWTSIDSLPSYFDRKWDNLRKALVFQENALQTSGIAYD